MRPLLSRWLMAALSLVLAVAAIGQTTTAPVITRTTPDAIVEDSAAFTLTVEGTNFSTGARIRFDGIDRTTTVVSSTRLTATIQGVDINSPGPANITVVSGGRTSNSVVFQVLPNDPQVTALDPSTVAAGTGEFTLRVTGQNFAPTARVRVGGVQRDTTYVSPTTLDARIPASDIATGGRTLQISVLNHNGQFSNNFPLTVSSTPLVPELTSISPQNVPRGGPDFTLNLVGRNFHPDAQVRIGTVLRTPVFVDSQHLQVVVPGSQTTTAGSLNIAVVNPGNRISNTLQLVVEAFVTPAITNITPESLQINTRNLTITVEGTNFEPNARVRVDGADRNTTFVSSTRLTASLLTADVSSVRTLNITVRNPGVNGQESAPDQIFVVGLNAPTITSTSPGSLLVGTTNLRIVVNGTNFLDGDTVLVNGTPRLTDFISATQLAATLLTEDVAATGELSISVRKGSTGVVSAPFEVAVVTTQTPVINSLNPTSANVNGAPFTLRILGENFAPDSTVTINGIVRTATYVSSTELTVAITTADLAQPGNIAVIVRNANGATTLPVNLPVIELLPIITSIDPLSAPAGDPGFTLTVTGQNFSSSAIVNIGGQPQASTRFNTTNGTLSVIVPSGVLFAPGPLAITVTDRGLTSLPITFNVLPPVITNVNPSTITAGSGDVTVTVTGTSFLPASRVSFKGGERATTFVSATQLTAVIPAAALLEPGTFALVVVNTSEAISSPFQITIASPGLPTIFSFAPGSAVAGNASQQLTIVGANFLPGAIIRVNGSDRATTFVNATELRTTLTAADLAAAGTLTITVVNPTGEVSTASSFTIEAAPVTGPRRRSVRH